MIREELNETVSENETLRSKTQVSEYKALLFDKLQSDYEALKSEMESLKGNVARETNAESFDTLKEKLNERESEVQQLKSKMSTMNIESSVKKEDVMHVRSTPSDLEKELNDKQDQIDSILEELSELTTENDVLNGEIAHLKIQNKMYDEVKKEFGSLNDQNHKLLTENSKMVKTIEELHQKMLNVGNHDESFLNEEREHVAREKDTLLQNIKQLEKNCEELGQKNSNLSLELLANEGLIQQLRFDNETMRAQLGIDQSGQIQMENFHDDYQRLQGQFSTAMDQKNKAQSELNQMAHRLQQRDARCQQLAMQISQLAEDRSYLNIQLGNLSKSLREKETELATLQQQYRILYQTHLSLQTKLLESETKTINIAMQRASSVEIAEASEKPIIPEKTRVTMTTAETSEADEIKLLRSKLQETELVRERLNDQHLALEKSLRMEQEQRQQLEETLNTMQEQARLTAENREFQIQMEEEDDRILESSPMLMRSEAGYTQRVCNWLRVRREYLCFSSRNLNRVMRMRPGIRKIIWGYFILLHILVFGCMFGLL